MSTGLFHRPWSVTHHLWHDVIPRRLTHLNFLSRHMRQVVIAWGLNRKCGVISNKQLSYLRQSTSSGWKAERLQFINFKLRQKVRRVWRTKTRQDHVTKVHVWLCFGEGPRSSSAGTALSCHTSPGHSLWRWSQWTSTTVFSYGSLLRRSHGAALWPMVIVRM